jgi:hypothetical protein
MSTLRRVYTVEIVRMMMTELERDLRSLQAHAQLLTNQCANLAEYIAERRPPPVNLPPATRTPSRASAALRGDQLLHAQQLGHVLLQSLKRFQRPVLLPRRFLLSHSSPRFFFPPPTETRYNPRHLRRKTFWSLFAASLTNSGSR